MARLPDLLVSEGLVDPETVVEVFEAQALYGGTFDTNLLELGFLDEARLLPYLERIYGVQNRVDVTGRPTAEALERLDAAKAVELRIVPFRIAGRVLDVVASDPTDLRALDEVAFSTGCRINVSVATEARIARLLSDGYGVPVPARLAAILERRALPKVRLHRPRPHAAPREGVAIGGFSQTPDIQRVRRAPAIATGPIVRAARVERRDSAPSKPIPPEPRIEPVVESVTERILRAEPEALAAPLADEARPRSEAELAFRLATTTERDQLPPIVLAYLTGLGIFERVLLLRLRKNELCGWDGRGKARRDRLLALVIDLNEPSLFAQVSADVTPYEGPLPRGAVEAAFLKQLDAAAWPGEVALVPIRVKGRVVAVLYADVPRQGELRPAHAAIASAVRLAAEALVRIILAKKAS